MKNKLLYNNSMKSNELFLAIENGNLCEAKRLLDEGADINAQDPETGYTPLHAAISFADSEMVQLLSSHRSIDFDLKDRFGRSPITLALSSPYEDIINILQAVQVKLIVGDDDEYGSPCP